MEIISIGSGSKGNCTLVITTNYNLLIDVGMSAKKINEGLLIGGGLDLEDVHFIAITHSHS